MSLFLILFCGFSILYCAVLWQSKRGLSKFKLQDVSIDESENYTEFSLVVSFRNEKNNLPNLLNSIAELLYPIDKFELILVNDHSTDLSHQEINKLISPYKFKIRLFHLSEIGLKSKKQAVNYGVQKAANAYILSVDADCFLTENLLKAHHQHIKSSKPDMIIGAVSFTREKSLLKLYQYYDFMAIQAMSMSYAVQAKPIACNAAHLCFNKAAFKKINPYADNFNIASGDDIFLMEKFKKNRRKIEFLKYPEMVLTNAQRSIADLINQRKRWLLKSKYIKNITAKRLGIVLLLGHLNFLYGLFLLFFVPQTQIIFGVYVIIKFILEYKMIAEFSKKYNLSVCVRELFIFGQFYPISIFIFSFAFLKRDFYWKSRKYNS